MFAVEMHDICKRFGGIKANDAIRLAIRQQSIHALVGENGAGKTTLMKILYGMYAPDRGSIAIQGRATEIPSPAAALRLGIGMVHQHFMLIPPFTVTENIILGSEPMHRVCLLDLKRGEKDVMDLANTYHIDIDPKAYIKDLSVGLQQRVELLKMLHRKSRILILDEPTAALTPQEVEELSHTLHRLKEDGKTIIIITHKLHEIMKISDCITVLRHGKVVFDSATQATTAHQVSYHMIGRTLDTPLERSAPESQQLVLEVNDATVEGAEHSLPIHNVAFGLKRGEILGIAGVEGNGQTTVVDVIAGRTQTVSGSVVFHQDRPKYGVAPSISHIPEDRHKYGLVLDCTVSDNFILGRQKEPIFSGSVMLHRKQTEEFSHTMMERFDIRPHDTQRKVRFLSGGNQQKLVIARELTKDSSLIIACQPTRGLDMGAREFVHQTIMIERNSQKAILLISSDLSELLALSDRIAVMYGGEIVAVLENRDCTEYALGLHMTGARQHLS